MNFSIGDKAVYPAHGVGIIKGIESKMIGGERQDFYLVEIMASGATVMVPTSATIRMGLRRLSDQGALEGVYSILRTPRHVSQRAWNRRFREFSDKLRTGSLNDVAEVLRDLTSLRGDKTLSFGEKNMLEKALGMVVSEISAASARNESDVFEEVNRLLLPN
ncbi:MAG: CarD family transcriptional regulator [Proteobacteria bacterium]|nr:CarD family transcriptional regulator [Pseudomonadota bacterium]